jgi:hypothetical protein
VGAPEDLRQRQLRLGVLRSFQEPLWQVVLDGRLRQQGQDPGVPSAHYDPEGLGPLRSAQTRRHPRCPSSRTCPIVTTIRRRYSQGLILRPIAGVDEPTCRIVGRDGRQGAQWLRPWPTRPKRPQRPTGLRVRLWKRRSWRSDKAVGRIHMTPRPVARLATPSQQAIGVPIRSASVTPTCSPALPTPGLRPQRTRTGDG